MSPPTAAEPWTVTLAWTPDQNFGAVSIMPRRVPLTAVLGLLRGGDTIQAICDEHDLTPQQLEVICRLMLDVPWEDQ